MVAAVIEYTKSLKHKHVYLGKIIKRGRWQC